LEKDNQNERTQIMKHSKETSRSYTLTSEEIENLLSSEFGDKIQPVNKALLAKQRQDRARAERFIKPARSQ
jgi:hypothetical protein